MTDATRPTFWQWFDSRKAQALATDIGKFMASRGYDVTHTGGGCLAWEGLSRDHWQAWITDDDAGLGDDLSDWQASQTFCAMLCHDDSGEFVEGPAEVTIEAALAWAEDAMAKQCPPREPHALDAMRIVYAGDNEGPAVMTLGELIRNFDMSGGWYDRMSAEHMREELDSRGWVSGLHENGHYLVMNVNRLRVEPHPTLDDEAFARKQAAAKPVCEPVDDETDKPACRHRDDGRGRCIDCGVFL